MKRTLILAASGIALVAFVAAVWVAAYAAGSEIVIVRYDQESRYYRIQVVDYLKEGRRCMHFSKFRGVQSSMILADPAKLDLKYPRSMMSALALHPAPKDVLLVGLGGGSIAKFIQKQFPDMRLDIVEIDPDVVKVCRDWFEFRGTANTRVIVMDGRMYLKRSPKTYDVILLDAYTGDRIPFHMTTQEFVELVKSRLKPGGVVASNLWEPGVAASDRLGPAFSRFYFGELKTFQVTFPQTYLCKSGSAGNIIILGSLDEKPVSKDQWVKQAEALAAGKDLGFDLPAQVRAEYDYLTTQEIREKPLTDDMAPVDTLRHENPKYFEEAQPK